MTPFLNGFGDELIKVGGVAGALASVGKGAVKHPLLALGAGTTLIGTGLATRAGYRQGMSGEGKPRFIAAGVNKYTGEAMPSDTAYTNFNTLFSNKKDKKVSKNYRENAFKG